MIIEMNPEDGDEVLGNSPDINDDFDPDVEPNTGSGPESDVEAEVERDSEAGFVPDLEYVPRGTELRQELSGILADANDLERLSFLSDPKDTYSRNRRLELQSKLSIAMDKLQRYKVKLDKEVLRCERNLARIRADSEKLNLEETRECYCQAESLQQKQYYEAVSDRDAVGWAITRVRTALSTWQIRSFPVWDPFLPDLPISSSPGYQNNPGRLGNEVDDLLSFGPLGKNQR